MPAIGLIDDRREHRTTARHLLEEGLGSGWRVVDTEPLPRLEDYPSWIHENQIAVLVLDERLHEQALDSEGHVDYDGHSLVDFFRLTDASFPIFILTSFREDDEVQQRFGAVEDIIRRTDFMDADLAKQYAARMVRAAHRFLQTFERELAKLSETAARVASGTADTEDLQMVKALQSKIGLAFPQGLSDRSNWISSIEGKLVEFAALRREIEEFLERESD